MAVPFERRAKRFGRFGWRIEYGKEGIVIDRIKNRLLEMVRVLIEDGAMLVVTNQFNIRLLASRNLFRIRLVRFVHRRHSWRFCDFASLRAE